MGFGLGLKLSRPQARKKGADDEEQWYIPYNGPYEPPRQTAQRSKARDSWGDPIEDEDDEFDSVLGDKELEKRFGGGYDEHSEHGNVAQNSSNAKKSSRDRSTSFASGRSQSSGVDPSRGSAIPRLRSHLSPHQKPSIPSYVSVDGGGVGESPAPQIWAKESGGSSRLSLASIFSFGSSNRKGNASPKTPKDKDRSKPSPRTPRPPKLKPPTEAAKVTLVLGPTSSSSSETQNSMISPKKFPDLAGDTLEPSKVDDDDYYNTYYSSLLKGPVPEVSPHNPGFGVNPRAAPRPTSDSTTSQQEALPSHSIHPYAYTFPKKESDAPTQEAPLTAREPPRLTFVPAPKESQSKPPATTPDGLGLKQVRGASSTPNLRPAGKQDNSSRGGDRWLSARTWCDAILFPRPRLKIKEEPSPNSRPIISPPVTPLVDDYGNKSSGPAPAVTSRVLAHSHSLIDLSWSKRYQSIPTHAHASTSRPKAPTEKAPRPKSFALDDMSMVHPVLSLEKVLEEGEELEHEREQWKRQAASSIGNARARTLSRARSKSLTQKGRIGAHRVQGSFDYLAARACLGSQNLTPVLPPRPHKTSFTDTLSSIGRVSHTHSSSLSRTKSLQTHSRGHSRSESGGRAGVKGPKLVAGGDLTKPELDDKLAGLEGALKREGGEQHQAPSSSLFPNPIDNTAQSRVSPTPSGISDVQMGIAISTPPPTEDVLDRESIRMPMHPYAQAGLSFQNEPRDPVTLQRTDQGPVATASDERPFISSHPYALAFQGQGSAELVADPRADGNVSPQRKMWAQLSPGVVREILPSELRYSPFLTERDTTSADDRGSVVGVGEALTYTSYRDSLDSGLGTSEGHVIQPYVPSPSPLGMQKYVPKPRTSNDVQPHPHREPVQYDASQPLYAHHRGRSADLAARQQATTTTVPFHMQTERLPVPRDLAPVSPSPVETSGTPSPHLTPRSLGSPNDLDCFQDLFYKPTQPSTPGDRDEHPFTSSSSGGVLTGEIALRSRRTGSGLTTLARQLSEEFEQMERERTRTSSQYSYSSGSVRPPGSLLRRPTEGSLQFVFEEMPRSSSPMQEEGEELEEDRDATEVFKPSFKLPEDVHSSASSMVEKSMEDEDDTAMFRVGVVESVSTPAAETSARRRSFTGFLSEDPQAHQHHPQSSAIPGSASSDKHLSTLLSPITDMTRSSYMTTSTSGSRMSNLSDFPIPPRDGPAAAPGHLSFLSSFHHERHGSVNFRELETVRDSPHPMHPHDRRFTFGFDQNAADVADELSNPDH